MGIDLYAAGDVPADLRFPVIAIIRRQRANANGAAVPKATVYENSDLVVQEREVRDARKRGMHSPASDPVSHEDSSEPPFRGAVPARTDPGHPDAALRCRQRVH
jgi:hypothetical protein